MVAPPPGAANDASGRASPAVDAFDARRNVRHSRPSSAVVVAGVTGCGSKSAGTPSSASRAASAWRRFVAELAGVPDPASSARTDGPSAAPAGGPGRSALAPVRAACPTAGGPGRGARAAVRGGCTTGLANRAAKRTAPDEFTGQGPTLWIVQKWPPL